MSLQCHIGQRASIENSNNATNGCLPSDNWKFLILLTFGNKIVCLIEEIPAYHKPFGQVSECLLPPIRTRSRFERGVEMGFATVKYAGISCHFQEFY